MTIQLVRATYMWEFIFIFFSVPIFASRGHVITIRSHITWDLLFIYTPRELIGLTKLPGLSTNPFIGLYFLRTDKFTNFDDIEKCIRNPDSGLTGLSKLTSFAKVDKFFRGWQVLLELTSFVEVDKFCQSWQVLPKLASFVRLDKFCRSWQVLSKLTSFVKVDKFCQSWQVLSKLTSFVKVDKFC